jgi:GNAT superfamily N-acetyltransferase
MAGSGFPDYVPGGVSARPLPASQVVVRHAVEDDIGGILETQARAGRTATGADALSAAICDQARLVVVASLDGDIVGWGKTHFWAYPDGPAPAGQYLGGVTVMPDLRRRGIAVALTQARLDWIWERTATAWYLVNPANRASIDLHRQWGFSEVARGAKFHTTHFTGGVGLLLRATRPMRD